MICKNCGQELPEGAGICLNCKTEVEDFNQVMENNHEQFGMNKCPKCGHIGVGVPGKIFTTKDIIIGVILFFAFFILGILYLAFIYGKRKNPQNRSIICPVCKTVMVKVDDSVFTKKGMSDAKNVATTLAKDENFRKSVKGLAKSVKGVGNSFHLD